MDDDEQIPTSKPLPWDWWILPSAAIVTIEGVFVSLHDGARILRSATVAHLFHRIERARFKSEAGMWIESLDIADGLDGTI